MGSGDRRWAAEAPGRVRAALGRLPGRRGRFEQRPDPADPLSRAVVARIADGDLDRAFRLARYGHRSRPGSLQLPDLRIALLDHFGHAEQALALAVSQAQRRIEWLDQRRRHRPPRRLGRSQRIFVAGYFKSGSSAVVDYLSDIAGVTKWTPGGELRIVKSVGGMADLVRRCPETGGLGSADLVDFYLHLTGWKITQPAPATYDRWTAVNRNSAALFRDRRTFGYLRTCLVGFQRLVELAPEKPTREELIELFRDIVEQALDAAATDTRAEVLLVDQGINAWRLKLARLLPPSTFVVVHRDPRDQFGDVRAVRAQPGRKPVTAASYVEEYRRRRSRGTREIDRMAAGSSHRAVPVSFEDFVLDHQAQAGALVADLGLTGRRQRRRHYRPAYARTGVGRHRQLLAPAEVELLTSSLPEYLHPRVTGG